MTTAAISATGPFADLSGVARSQVEDFLYHEAELLDAWNLNQWIELFTDDAKYEIPCNDAPDGSPAQDLMLIDDNMLRLSSRVDRLNSRRAHREYPHSRTNHQIFNVRISYAIGEDLCVGAGFTVWRFRNGRESRYVGKYRYRLALDDTGALRIRFKRAVLDMTDLRGASDVAVIL